MCVCVCVETEDKDVVQHNMVFQLARNVIIFSFAHHYDSVTLSFYSSSIINGHIVLMVIKDYIVGCVTVISFSNETLPRHNPLYIEH